MPSCFAACPAVIPASTRFCKAKTVSDPRGGLPGFLPFSLAAWIPSLVRSEISLRSKCAMAPKTWKINSPAADVVSIRSSRLISPIFCAFRFSTVSSSSLSDRPRRSSRVMARLSPGRAWSSNAVNPGRSNCLPEMTSSNTRMAPAFCNCATWPVRLWSCVETRAYASDRDARWQCQPLRLAATV